MPILLYQQLHSDGLLIKKHIYRISQPSPINVKHGHNISRKEHTLA